MRWLEHLEGQLADRRALHLERQRRVLESPCEPHVRVTGPDGQTRELLAFCSNDYLGLAHHPVLTAACVEGAQRWGAGSGASHLVSGHTRAHADLEAALADSLAPHIPGAQALFFCTGYMANLALLAAVASNDATVFSDKLNHASLIDGAMLGKAWTRSEIVRYPHTDVSALAERLRACTTAYKFIVTDSVFSMDGDLAPLPDLLVLAEAFDAMLIVDDAHAFGVLGASGAGSLEHFGLRSERLIVMGTLGKAAGVSGAFVAAHPTVIRWLVNTARPYIYTTASPPAVAHTLLASLALMRGPEGCARRSHLLDLVAQLRAGLAPLAAQRGWTLMDSPTAIQPLVVGDNATALALSDHLLGQGLWVPAIRPPTVPEGSARLRIVVNAAHTDADVDRLLNALACAPPP